MADRSYKLTLSLSDGSTINAGTITAPQGPNGANGKNGATFIPSVSAAGVLSWTNNGGLTNPPPINIKGPKGDDAVITASDVEGWGFTKNKGTVTSVAVKINGTIKGTVTSSGTIDLGTFLTAQDISGKANLDGGNIFTGKQTLNSPGSDGYSINAAGYVKGSWLQSSAIANKGANTGKVCVFDNSGWIYYRTPAEILTEAGGAKTSDIPNVSGKANLNGGNTFSGAQIFKDHIEFVDSNGDVVLSLGNNAIFVDPEERGLIPVSFSGSFGLSGQVLTSQGHNTTPIWEYVTKHGYTELTDEDLNTITEAGWYRAAANNTCTNKPSNIGSVSFLMSVGEYPGGGVVQKVYAINWPNDQYIRFFSDSWKSWVKNQSLDSGLQFIYGHKRFLNGIGLDGTLKINGSSGTTGQVLMSNGDGIPKWATLSGNFEIINPRIQGNSYQIFDASEDGYFTGIFNLGTADAPTFTIHIGAVDSPIPISVNPGQESSIIFNLTLWRQSSNLIIKLDPIYLGTATIDHSFKWVYNAYNKPVVIYTTLTSSYQEESLCFVTRSV